MASSRLLILCFLVALTLSYSMEATMARRLLNIPGFPNMGNTFPLPTLQSPPLPTFPPYSATPSTGTGLPFFPFPTPSTPSFPRIFTPPATGTTNP
ncbi:unnamed protein product [Lactuca virosa]|uniref:Uncharacterized protein n=1 Tax=Lactuca virosa TaxID=75947 RepID=A0AAU9PJL7_9ASTR|nr:unnamed protein product [Lactuca virosa]